ncbi:MAG TPA: type II toxin-antitoxin system HicB family antitoxin [Mariniphaga anaerophila]|jgi:predicted RNase H-like HicB family nuclease|uniref:Type II toxin-antitoxin system HicB family antitoxin n=1 Tax=Mariniphaga anaerophila TaxID=1484053 RepID=A0A831LMM5_9BACT|nr:type II toxin-antitoxin system HicB family antitoxin [Mariniphaga anaerophila]
MVVDNLSFTAVFVEVPEGGYSAFVEEIPGANTQGETLEEARENLKEALQLVLETNKMLSQKTISKGTKSHKEPLLFSE